MTARATAQTDATTIKNETTAGANTATRVGSNLLEIATNALFNEDIGTTVDLTATALSGAGTTLAHVATVAEKLRLVPTSMSTITTGTTQPISFTDALFTGLTAGGQALGASGALGVIATSFASSGAEVGTGAGQGGLGTAASSTQPYNSTDFPGKRVHCDLRKSNNEPLILSDVLATAAASYPASVSAPVFLYLAYRSDLGADAKWRGWFYFVDQATGNKTPVVSAGSGLTSVATVTLQIPQVVAEKDVPTNAAYVPVQSLGAAEVVFGAVGDISHPQAAAAAGASGKVADAAHAHGPPTADVPMASHGFTGMRAGIAAGEGVIYEQLSGAVIPVAACTTIALPAYVFTPGTLGVGDTITASANGTFPTLDATVTLVANDPVLGAFLFQNGASATDHGVWMATSLGSGGSKWSAIRHPACDTAVKVAGSKIRVRGGQQSGGGEYEYQGLAAVVMNTINLFWLRTDAKAGPNERLYTYTDCGATVLTINTQESASNWFMACVGTSPTVAQAADNTAAENGVYQFGSGSTAVGLSGFQGSDATPAAGGDAVLLGANLDLKFECRFKVPALSTSGQEFALNFGLVSTRTASQKTPASCVAFLYDRTSAVSTVNLLAACTNGGTGTPVDTGIVLNANQYYRLYIRRPAGDTNVYFYIDGVLVSTQTSNVPTAVLIGTMAMLFASVGTTTKLWKCDWLMRDIGIPTRRAA